MKRYPCKTHTDAVSGEAYLEISHPSGALVFVYPKKLTTAYAMFTTRYGSLERTFRTDGGEWVTLPDGVAHFLEHKLFEEEDGSDVFERFAALGASANAFTSNEMTSYLFSTTSDTYAALSVLLSFVMHPYFTKENVQKEMGIIGQEIDMYEDRPMSRLFYATLEALYKDHNVKINIAGTKETISSITPEILYRAYHTFYHPSNMILTVVGDVEAEKVLDVVDAVLGTDGCEERKIECQYPTEEEGVLKEYTELSMQIAKPMFALALKDLSVFSSPKERLRHTYTVELLLKLLFSRSAPFYNSLYTRGLITDSFSVMYEPVRSCAHLLAIGESDDVDTVFFELERLLRDIPDQMLKQKDFLRLKKAMYAENIRTLDSTESIAYDLTEAALHDLTLWDTGEAIRSITYEELRALADNFFKEKQFVRVVIRPTEN